MFLWHLVDEINLGKILPQRHTPIVIGITASVASWVREGDFFTHGPALREVGGSNPGRDTMLIGSFSSNKATTDVFSIYIYLQLVLKVKL